MIHILCQIFQFPPHLLIDNSSVKASVIVCCQTSWMAFLPELCLWFTAETLCIASLYSLHVSCCCCCCVASVVSDSVRPHRQQPTTLPIPGTLQAIILEWVAISFSNAWKWKVKSEVIQLRQTLRPHGLQPTRLLHPWDFLGKSTGVGCHCLLRYMWVSLI